MREKSSPKNKMRFPEKQGNSPSRDFADWDRFATLAGCKIVAELVLMTSAERHLLRMPPDVSDKGRQKLAKHFLSLQAPRQSGNMSDSQWEDHLQQLHNRGVIRYEITKRTQAT